MANIMVSVYNPVTDSYCDVPLDRAMKLLEKVEAIRKQVEEINKNV